MSVFRRGQKGFTLTEIMVVTAIITLIVGMALPNFTRMKANANKGVIIKTLRTLNTAFEEFWQDQNPHRYPRNLSELASIPAIQGSPPYVDERLTNNAAVRYDGYYIDVKTPSANTYSIQATPINPTISGQEIYAIGVSGSFPSGSILVCPSGNTEDKFKEIVDPTGRAPTYSTYPGHPVTYQSIPAGD